MCLRYLSPVTNNKDPALSFVEGCTCLQGYDYRGVLEYPHEKEGSVGKMDAQYKCKIVSFNAVLKLKN